jgi:hypothetical protein
VDDAIHGSRGGGTQHAVANGSSAGFLSALAPGFLNSNGTTTSWITQIQWSALTSLPTLTTTLPLTGGGTCCSLTLGINAATTSTAGSMSAADKLKLDGIPNATTANFGLVLTPSVNLAGQYVLISPTNLGYIKGSGAQYYLPRYTAIGTTLENSSVSDTGAMVTIANPLTVSGVDTTTFRMRNGSAAGYLMVGDATGVGSWNGISSLGLNTGSGTLNYLPKYTATGTTFGNSSIIDTGTAISTTLPVTIPKLSIIGAFTSGNDTIPALGSTAGRANKFTLLNDGGTGNYGLIGGVLGNGNAFLQAQRVDGTATAYNMLFQPNGGAAGFGVVDPTASVDIGNTLRIRGGSPAVGNLWAATDTSGNGSWSNSISGLTGITFAQSAVSPVITQTTTSDSVAQALTIQAQGSSSAYGGPTRIVGGTGPNVNNGKVASGEAGTVTITANGDQPSASFGSDMVDITAPLLIHGNAVFSTSNESHVLSRQSGLAIFEDVRWFQHSQSSTSSFSVDIPTGMDGKWTVVYEIYATGLDTMHVLGSVFTRSGGALTWSNSFTEFNGIPGSFGPSASADNMRLTITPPSSSSIMWTIKAKILRV